MAASRVDSRHSFLLPGSSFPLASCQDSRPRAPSFPSCLPKTPVRTPSPQTAPWNENYVKRPTLTPCRQRPKSKNSTLSQEVAGGSGKPAAKTPPLGHGGSSSGTPVELHGCSRARQLCPDPHPPLPEKRRAHREQKLVALRPGPGPRVTSWSVT